MTTVIDTATSESLLELNRRVARDLTMLALPENWIPPRAGPDASPIFDVIIVGAGMYGIAAAAALKLKGITSVLMLDEAPEGSEGPWLTYARMKTLRSAKTLPGPCLGIPSLTFRAWYEAAFGAAAWEALHKAPNAVWQEYLTWLRRRLDLPLESNTKVAAIDPFEGGVTLSLVDRRRLHARRVVLATGRTGIGGPQIPERFDEALWPDLAAHSVETIDFDSIVGKRVAVVGAAASAWDNAATALEAGACSVDLYCRRKALPQVNKWRAAATPGFLAGWTALGDEEKWELFSYLNDNLSPPPHETVQRTILHAQFQLHFSSPVLSARRNGNHVELELPKGRTDADFLIVGTGFAVDLSRDPLLSPFASRVARWSDRFAPAAERPALGASPYLDDCFALTPAADQGSFPLSRIHIFSHAAMASLGVIASDVPGVNMGAERLAAGLSARFFAEDFRLIKTRLEAYSEPELVGTPYHIPEVL